MVELSLYWPISIHRKSNSFCSACVQTPGYDINKCCYFCDNNLPVGVVIPLITVTENKEFASKSCSTDYLKLEAASRFKNAMMNWLFKYWIRSLDPRIRLTGSVFEKINSLLRLVGFKLECNSELIFRKRNPLAVFLDRTSEFNIRIINSSLHSWSD